MATTPFMGKGMVVYRGDEGYDSHNYQYATSSHKDEGIMNPSMIFYPLNDDDVRMAVAWAQANKRAIAVRTGGHQYSGASSTYGDNLVLDLNDTYTDFVWKNTDNTRVKVGVSLPLGKLNSLLMGAGRFVPHGQCCYVHVGGHCQTGGYGQLIRGFGLMADHIHKFRIITADGKIVSVRRDDENTKDLFFALAGGCPGNIGIVTHVTLNVRKDQNHFNSWGYRAIVKYDRLVLEKLLSVLVKMDTYGPMTPEGPEGRPADYDLCVTVISEKDRPGEPSKIVVFAQWADLKGYSQTCDQGFFQELRDIVAGHVMEMPTPIGKMPMVTDKECPLSELSSHWLFPIAREFEHPYIKRTYVTKASGDYLQKQEWAKWAADRVDQIEKVNPAEKKCKVSAQFQYTGGRGNSKSAITKGDPEGRTAISWRDATFGYTLDVFYKPEGAQFAKDWQKTNDHEAIGNRLTGRKGKFSEYDDLRLIWGSFDTDLIKAKKHYFDSDAKFERLVAIKKKVDPNNLFTANQFAVVPPNTLPGKEPHKHDGSCLYSHFDPYLRACGFLSDPGATDRIFPKIVPHSSGYDALAAQAREE